jgi:hypothetical protein
MTRWRWLALALVVAVSLVAQQLFEPHYLWERLPGFYALYGFAGCTAIIFLSKWYGKLLVQRKEEYYDRE